MSVKNLAKPFVYEVLIVKNLLEYFFKIINSHIFKHGKHTDNKKYRPELRFEKFSEFFLIRLIFDILRLFCSSMCFDVWWLKALMCLIFFFKGFIYKEPPHGITWQARYRLVYSIGQ